MVVHCHTVRYTKDRVDHLCFVSDAVQTEYFDCARLHVLNHWNILTLQRGKYISQYFKIYLINCILYDVHVLLFIIIIVVIFF